MVKKAHPPERSLRELDVARKNAAGSTTFKDALASSPQRFEDSLVAVEADRIGRPPPRDVIPATNASSLYSSTDETKSRKR